MCGAFDIPSSSLPAIFFLNAFFISVGAILSTDSMSLGFLNIFLRFALTVPADDASINIVSKPLILTSNFASLISSLSSCI